jgi:uncharacterized secreted protein with C-terminal beta-propeller domain
VSTPSNPVKKWEQSLKNNARVVESRLMKDQLYVVLETSLSPAKPCPYEIMAKDTTTVSIPCTDIYHPNYYVESNATTTVMKISPTTGDISGKTSFISAQYQSVISMFPESLYVTYQHNTDYFTLMYQFLKEQGTGLVDDATIQRLAKVSSYDISNQAKMVEMQTILQPLLYPSSEDERLKLQNDLQNKFTAFAKQHKRDFEKTAIVKVDIQNLSVGKTATIPGRVLNQFAMDEYKSHLRIATTVGENIWGWGFGGSNQESANDVYVLDGNLNTVGKVTDLGTGERIYSARFIGDKAYLVTFKQTDPFYILNLSDPRNPTLSGQLKIPGYSAYLHPLSDTVMLGIGKDGAYVKATLFDVSQPQNPQELDTYTLKDYNSDILQTHLAFLHDPKYQMFFVPGNTGGFIFTYAGNKLQLAKTVAGIEAKRALYINDVIYIVSSGKITALQEGTWNQVGDIDLSK